MRSQQFECGRKEKKKTNAQNYNQISTFIGVCSNTFVRSMCVYGKTTDIPKSNAKCRVEPQEIELSL